MRIALLFPAYIVVGNPNICKTFYRMWRKYESPTSKLNFFYEFSGSEIFSFPLTKKIPAACVFSSLLLELTLSHPHGTGISVYTPRFFFKIILM